MSDVKTVEDEYLGDGVYASFDGWHIVLDLRGQDNTTQIVMEPTVLDALDKFRAKAGCPPARGGARLFHD